MPGARVFAVADLCWWANGCIVHVPPPGFLLPFWSVGLQFALESLFQQVSASEENVIALFMHFRIVLCVWKQPVRMRVLIVTEEE